MIKNAMLKNIRIARTHWFQVLRCFFFSVVTSDDAEWSGMVRAAADKTDGTRL